jgi:hypothetical protein
MIDDVRKLSSKQEIFDFVVNHLTMQGKQSVKLTWSGYDCVYYGPDGNKCAVGCLIHEEEYDKRMENYDALTIIKDFPSLSRLKDYSDMLEDLQGLHDCIRYYDDGGFTKLGYERIKDLKERYNLI